jgi:hypothetical protein
MRRRHLIAVGIEGGTKRRPLTLSGAFGIPTRGDDELQHPELRRSLTRRDRSVVVRTSGMSELHPPLRLRVSTAL